MSFFLDKKDIRRCDSLEPMKVRNEEIINPSAAAKTQYIERLLLFLRFVKGILGLKGYRSVKRE